MTAESRPGAWRRAVSRATGRDTRERLDSLERRVRTLAEVQREHGEQLRASVEALAARVSEQATRKDMREVLKAIRALGAQFDRSVEDQLAHGGAAEQQRLMERRLFKHLDALAASTKPILVGPWTGEVGFELLYWVPFLAWIRSRWDLAPERQIVVSRGGVHSWYGLTEGRYVDAFSLLPPEDFRAATNQEEHKQRRASAFDRQLRDAALASLGTTDAEQLHPEQMYRIFMPFWREEAGFSLLDRFTRYARLTRPDDPVLDTLPAEYIACRFYFSDAFPDGPENRAFARTVIGSMAERLPVVLLNPRLSVDDHADLAPPDASGRVFTIADGLKPERNLEVQSAVISRARAFVGTYGGYSYLAPFHNVPAVAFYSAASFKLHHLQVAQRVFARLGDATVLAIDTAHAGMVQLALGTVTAGS